MYEDDFLGYANAQFGRPVLSHVSEDDSLLVILSLGFTATDLTSWFGEATAARSFHC